MDRSVIKRKDLKKNFLKEIIMRLDFQGVLKVEMEQILLVAKPYLKSKGFNRYAEKASSQIVEEDAKIKDIKTMISYSFIAESLGYSIELSVSSIILSVKTQGYASFEEYADIFRTVSMMYKDKIDFFTCKRFGLRKINFCFLKSKQEIKKYFSPEYYNFCTPIDGVEANSIQRRDALSDGFHTINLRYVIERGTLDTDNIYKATIDTDIFLTDQDKIENLISDIDEMMHINEKMFRIYLGTITDDFISFLSNLDMDDDNILGVENNA